MALAAEPETCPQSTRAGGALALGAPELRRVAGRLYRTGRGVLALAMLLQIILVFAPVVEHLYGWLDVTGPPEPADAIICLGGRDHRLVWAADLFHEGFAPRVIVSNLPGAAEAMRDVLVRCSVPAEQVLVDRSSFTTGDHAGRIAAIPGVAPADQRFLIVTDRAHSRRVAACFREAGFKDFTVCAGSSTSSAARASSFARWRWRVLVLPTLAYEYTALIKYRIEGKI